MAQKGCTPMNSSLNYAYSIDSASRKKSAIFRWAVSCAAAAGALAITGSAWAASGPNGLLGQAATNSCPCPAGTSFLTSTAGYAVRWLLIIAFFVLSAVASFALGRSRKRAEQT